MSASTPESRGEALAARRALVRRDTSLATVEVLGREAARRLRAKARKLPAAGNAAAATVTAQVDETLLQGPDGTITYCNVPCSTPGDVGPGEPLSVWEELGVTGGTTGTNYTVQLSWTESCGGTAVKTFGSQTVTIQDGVLWYPASPTGYNAASTCPGASASTLPNYALTLNMSVTGGGSTSFAFDANWIAIPAGQVMGCPSSPDSSGATRPQGTCGDPVDTSSGIFSDTFIDATLKSPGYPLAIERSYSSAVTSAGALGPGWNLPWQTHLSVDSSTGNATFVAENGDTYVYTKNSSGGFTAPAGARSVLTATSSGYALTAPDQHVLDFNTSGQLTAENDPTGRGLALTYNGSGQVSSITDAAGQAVSLSYSGGLLTEVGLPGGQSVSYAYTSGLLTSVTDPDGHTTTYGYTSAGLLASVKDPDGNYTVRNTYNSSGQVTSQEDGAGNMTTFSYTTTSGGLPETDVTSPDGGITSDVYAGGMLIETVDPLVDTSTYVYNKFLQTQQVTDPLGNVTTMSYDSSGNLTGETDALGNSQSWTYDSHDNPLSHTDADGNKTTSTYNSMDEVLTTTTTGSHVTSYTYNTDGSLASETDARGYKTIYSYTSDGLLESVTNADGNATSYAYDAMGFPVTVTDALSHARTYTYDADERVVSVTTPGGGITKYSYDGAGNLTSRTDPDGNTWSYAYDQDNRLAKATDPLGNSSSYGYDGDGNQTSFTDGRGIITTTAYDADNHPVKITYSDGTPAVSYAYDADGHVTSVTDGTGTRSLSYDSDGHVTAEGGFSYAYDAAGNITSRSYPDGTSISYGYDTDGQVSSMTVGSAKATYSYDADGNLVSTVDPDGITESRGYDNADQLTSVKDTTSSSTLDSYGLTLNADGQPTAVAVTQDGTAQPTRYYGYDSSGRLTSECYSASGSSACTAASQGTAAGSATSPSAPSGPMTSGETGLCADDSSSGTAAGNKIDIYTCNGTGAQTWTAADDGTLQVLGDCLAEAGISSGSVVELEPCTAHDTAEQWRQGSGWEVVNPASGLCLTDPSGSTTIGTQLQATTCAGSVAQEWRLPSDASGYVTDGVTGKCMDDANDSSAAGNKVQIWSCYGDAAQTWTVASGWQIEINGACLEPSGAGTAQNTVLVIETCASSTAQDWAAGPDGWLWNVNAAKCASDPSAATTNGTQLIIAGCASPLNTQQTWRVPQALSTAGALTSGVSGECADNDGGTEMVIYSCNSTGPEIWTVNDDGTIRTHDGLCAVLSGGATASGTKVALGSCTGATTQGWAVGPGGAWVDAVATQGSEYCLTDPSNSTTGLTQLDIAACSGATGQQWKPAATTLPAAATGVTVTAGAASATVSWTPPVSGGGDEITGYVITSSGGQKANATADTSSATVAGLTPGTSYTFTVTADTALGTSVTAATSAITPGNEITYSYDAAGNLTNSQTDGIATANSYNAAEELTKSVAGSSTQTYGYDAAGNQTSAGSSTYTYNAANELTAADTAAGNYAYSYNNTGDLATTGLDGTELSATVWDSNSPLAEAAEQITPSGTTTADLTWNPDGSLAAQVSGSSADYAVADWEGSVTGLVSSSGAQVASTAYSAYGTPSTTGSATSSIGYTGAYALTGSGGLDNMRARDYSPVTEQFTSVDPLLVQSGEPYTYAANNPAIVTDPSGDITCPAWLGFGCGVVTDAQNAISGTINNVLNTALPDYISACAGYGRGAASEACISITRDGSVYVGAGSGEGAGALGNISFGYIASPSVSNCAIDSFVSGGSLTASGGSLGVGAGVTWGDEGEYGSQDFSYEFGFATPGAGLIQSGSTYWFTLPG